MVDHYAVVGNPVEHSKSPVIHQLFAQQTHCDIEYARVLSPLDTFAATIQRLHDEGYKGCNITVPFKFEAFKLADKHHESASMARAVNTFKFQNGLIEGYNTDGIGLVRDISQNLGFAITNKAVLILGAGGAAFGVMLPLLRQSPASLVIANRTITKADEAAGILSKILSGADWQSKESIEVVAKCFDDLAENSFDIIINATSAGLSGEKLAIPDEIFTPTTLAYDMMYGRETSFMTQARDNGACIADGLGMLVEQAAESFFIWQGVRPNTAPVLSHFRV